MCAYIAINVTFSIEVSVFFVSMVSLEVTACWFKTSYSLEGKMIDLELQVEVEVKKCLSSEADVVDQDRGGNWTYPDVPFISWEIHVNSIFRKMRLSNMIYLDCNWTGLEIHISRISDSGKLMNRRWTVEANRRVKLLIQSLVSNCKCNLLHSLCHGLQE